MMTKLKIRFCHVLMALLGICLYTSCNNEEDSEVQEADINILFSVNTRAVEGENAQDSHFGSLMAFMFNKGGGFMGRQVITIGASPVTTTKTMINCPAGSATLLLVANYDEYADLASRLATTRYSITQLKAELASKEALTGEADLLMISEEIAIPEGVYNIEEGTSSATIDKAIELHRLAARIDVIVCKEEGWNETVNINKITLINQVTKTTLTYDGEAMPSGLTDTDYHTVTLTPTGDKSTAYPSDDIHDPQGIFYSYRNLSTVTGKPTKVKIEATIGGTTKEYEVFIANGAETDVRLQPNNLYRLKVILKPDNGIIVKTTIVPWTEESFKIEWAETTLEFGPESPENWNTEVKYGLTSATKKTVGFKFIFRNSEGAEWKAQLDNPNFNFSENDSDNGIIEIGKEYIVHVEAVHDWNPDWTEKDYTCHFSLAVIKGGQTYQVPLPWEEGRSGSGGTKIQITQVEK